MPLLQRKRSSATAAANAEARPGDAPLLSVRDVWKWFGSLTVLRGAELTVEAGEVVALLGRSGSAKSTLPRCIAQLELVDAGLIELDGELLGYRIEDEHLVALGERQAAPGRRAVGMVFQHFHLFPHMKVLDNVSFAPVATKQLDRADARPPTSTAPAALARPVPRISPASSGATACSRRSVIRGG